MRVLMVWIVTGVATLGACGSVEYSPDGQDVGQETHDGTEGAADADAVPDAETDAAADADADTDADSDADEAVEVDGGVDTDAEVPADADADADVAPEADADPDADVAETTTPECGNGRVEAPEEECDDGNEVSGDGCEIDCTYSCDGAEDCPNDGNPCTTAVCADVPGGRACRHDFNTLPCDDEDSCTTGDHCSAGACLGSALPLWFLDGDGDRYGAPDRSVCAAVAPSGYVNNALDCSDQDNQVRPDQTAWFDAASAPCTAAAGDAFWDYNCSRLVEQRDIVCGACVSSGTSCTASPSGWAPAVDGTCMIECGADASWVSSCRRESSTCLPNLMTTRQRCH